MLPAVTRLFPVLLALAAAPQSGCFYKVGSGLMAGVLDEAGGVGKSGGVDPIVEGLVQRALLAELGHQLGQGLQSGATEITPEQQAALGATIDGLIAVATARAGLGLRRDVSPELRGMVERDIVEALSEGLRGELGDSLEVTVDRVVTRATRSLQRNLGDGDLPHVTADLLRDAIYLAMREGGASPAVGETLQLTLEENVLNPFSTNVEGLAGMIADKVNEQARRTEDTLKAVIGGLAIVLGFLGILYFTTTRRLRRETESKQRTELDLRTIDAALSQLDEGTRQQVKQRLDQLRQVSTAPPKERAEDYLR